MQKKRLITILAIAISPLIINGYLNIYIYHTPLLYWAFEIFSWIIVPLVAWRVAKRDLHITLHDIGIRSKIFQRKSITLIVLFSAIIAPAIFLVYNRSYHFFKDIFDYQPLFEYEVMIPQSGILNIIVLLYFSLSAGIVEEFYRGLVYRLSKYYAYPQTFFLFFSPLIFALPHWENGLVNLSATYVVGLFFALIFLVSKNLIPLIIGHIYTDMLWFS